MSLDPDAAAGLGTVRVVGTGLLGTSIALGLRACGVHVVLHDASPTSLALARDLGAGVIDTGWQPPTRCALVVVAAPPDVTAEVVLAELELHPEATVTDVASVKSGVLRSLTEAGGDLARYVGSHPMGGRERSGPMAGRADLFVGRPWVICPTPKSEAESLDVVRRLATSLGAAAVTMSAEQHDAAVAVVSHVPQLAASLVAGRLRDLDDEAVALAGPGLRDLTRIAGSDPLLWAQILAANAGPVLRALAGLRVDLDSVIAGLTALDDQSEQIGSVERAGSIGARAAVARVIADGNLGRERIPGKHGGTPTRYAVLTVVLPDEPGALARLFADIGAAEVNVEELALEHAPGRAVGLLEVSVLPAAREPLAQALLGAGWRVVA